MSQTTTTTTGETYEYREIEDNPDRVANKLVCLEFPFTFSKGAGGVLGIAGDVMWGVTDNIQATGHAALNFIQIKGGTGFNLEFGPTLTMGTKSKEKEARVVLKWSDRSYDVGNTRVTEKSATWLNATATYQTKFKLRAGGYVQKYSYENDKDFNFGKLPVTTAGVYAGVEIAKQAALVSEVDGKKGITSGYTRIYADAFILPLRSFGPTDVGGTIRSQVGGGFLGGRFGFQTIFNPNRSKKAADGPLMDYQVYSKLFFRIETGYRPAEGIFFTMGGGFLIWKNR
jgi:hypothetical protein